MTRKCTSGCPGNRVVYAERIDKVYCSECGGEKEDKWPEIKEWMDRVMPLEDDNKQ